MSKVKETAIKQKQDTMFNITPERNKELEQAIQSVFNQYKDNKITNCELVNQAIALTDNTDERLYLAYQCGCFVVQQQQEDPFQGLLNALSN